MPSGRQPLAFRTMRRVGAIRRMVAGVLLAAGLAPLSLASAQADDQPPEPTHIALNDAQVLAAAGDLFFLRQEMSRSLFRSDDLMSQLRRVGIERGCRLFRSQAEDVEQTVAGSFRTFIINVMRSEVPTQVLELALSNRDPALLGAFRARVERRLRAFETNPMSTARRILLGPLQVSIRELPDVQGDWRGRFADWNFERNSPDVYRNACLIEALPDPAQAKLAFDQFYEERGI